MFAKQSEKNFIDKTEKVVVDFDVR